MKLSVVLPCFNGASTIAVQLQALGGQTWPGGWELIVVDNGSTDSSMELVETFRSSFPEMTIVRAHQPGTVRLGVPHSYNTGIQAATGDAFVFCEADDEVAPGWLAAMGRALGDHDFVLARLEHRKLNPVWLHPVRGNGYQADGLFRIPFAPHLFSASAAGFGLRRSLYEQLGPLSIEFPIVHDGEYCLRAQLAGYSLHFEPEAVVHYRERSDLAARFRQGRSWGWDTTRMYHHYGLPQVPFALARKGVWIARCLPSGILAVLSWPFGPAKARQHLADWVWNMGWFTGQFLAIRSQPAPSRDERTRALLARPHLARHEVR